MPLIAEDEWGMSPLGGLHIPAADGWTSCTSSLKATTIGSPRAGPMTEEYQIRPEMQAKMSGFSEAATCEGGGCERCPWILPEVAAPSATYIHS